MSHPLIARMHAARERTVPLFDGHSVTVRRPTTLELLEYRAAGAVNSRTMFAAVVNWAGFREADLVPSGASDEIAFDAELWALWITDHPQYWSAVTSAWVEMVQQHSQAGEDAAKN